MKTTEEIIEFLESKDTYKKVCQILASYDVKKEIGNIKGFIAGGSVSNILISMLHGGEPIVNDIDIYQEVKEENGRGDWYPTSFINEEGLEILNDEYGRIFVDESGARMKVNGHSRRGIINFITYVYNKSGWGKPHTQSGKNKIILHGFDLNCCKAGLDLENSEIVYNSDFVEYLRTKQLKVIHPCAPIQTAIRIYKKMRDLDCYCDVEHEMRFLTVAFKNVQSAQICRYIGVETYSKYQQYKDFVGKYFKLRKPENSEEIPYSLRKDYYIGNKVNPKINIWLFDAVMDFNVIECCGTMNKMKRIWHLLYTTKKK